LFKKINKKDFFLGSIILLLKNSFQKAYPAGFDWGIFPIL
jgi:hypothetical protein